MHLIARSKIHIPTNRHRQEFDPTHIQELADDFTGEIGLLQPIVLRKPRADEPAIPADCLVLSAGENRLRAIDLCNELGSPIRHAGEEIPLGLVPYIPIGELSELAAEEAELNENLKRRDLTWQEKAAAVKRLDNLRRKQKGEAHNVTELAKELTGHGEGSYRETVRQELLLANHLDNPTVAKAKTAAEAFKALRMEERKRSALGKAETFTLDMVKTRHRLFNADCLQWMAQAVESGEQFDVILTDPPYGMNAESFGDGAGKMTSITHEYQDDFESWSQLMQKWAELSWAITKPQAHLYAFCDIQNFYLLRGWMQHAGWYVLRTPLIYYKTDNGRVPLPDIGPRRQYETILYAVKGKKPVTNIYPDVICATGDTNLGHGAQKPVACYQNLLQRSCLPGDKVLDTFCGTGTIFPAAQNMKVIATGIEKDPVYYGIAAKRLEDTANG